MEIEPQYDFTGIDNGQSHIEDVICLSMYDPLAIVRCNLLQKEIADGRVRQDMRMHSDGNYDYRVDKDGAFYKVGVDFVTNRPVFRKRELARAMKQWHS